MILVYIVCEITKRLTSDNSTEGKEKNDETI